MSRLLLLSTYELGARPLGCTVPAAHLAAAGHQVVAVDLAVQLWPEAAVAAADGVVLSVPMHTAWRLGLGVLDRLRATRPEVPVALHGLYADAAADAAGDRLGPGDLVTSGEAGPALVEWADGLAHLEVGTRPVGTRPVGTRQVGTRAAPKRWRDLGPARPAARPPQGRAGLPGLESYAVLRAATTERLVGTLELSTGCNHRCRHCPVPVVYGGRSRPVALETALTEADALVGEGARHLHLADPDLLNRPAHAVAFARELAAAHPGVSFDATIKVSHLLRHADLLGELARCGLSFVISALESTSDTVLARLDKGHRGVEGQEAIRLLRRHGVEPRPSFLPFTPWTTRDDVVDLLDLVAEEDLVWNVDPVQYGIRLLLPPGSLLLERPDPDLAAALTGADPDAGGTGWRSADPALDRCQEALAGLAEELEGAGADPDDAYDALRAAALSALERPSTPRPVIRGLPGPPGPSRPRLSESWFCCAEPTGRQRAGLAGTDGTRRADGTGGAEGAEVPRAAGGAAQEVRLAAPRARRRSS